MEELKNKLPFHAIISGPTNCGKTQFLVDQLRGPFRYKFEYICLVCPTYPHNSTYFNFANGDKRFIVICPGENDLETINNILSLIETTFSGTNCLIILDDCAVSKDLKSRTNNFINLAFSGRHKSLSLWVLTQQLTSISKPFRDNVACVISFHNPSQVGTKTLFDDYGGTIDPADKKKFQLLLKKHNFSKLCFCLRHPFQIYLDIPSPNNLKARK